MPESVIRAADAHLRELNAQGAAVNVTPPAKPESDQVSLADVGADAVAERLRAVDPNMLSPLEALRLLFELKTISDKKGETVMKKGEKLLLVLGALLIAAGVFVGVTLGWDYSPNNYAYNEIEFTTADTETGECSFVSVQLSDLEVNIYSTTDKTVSIAARGAKTPDRVSVVLDGGVLRITEKKPGLFQRLAVSDDDAVILRIPEKWVGTVDAATQSGDVYVSGLVSPQLTLRASSASGAVSASELKVAETQLVTTSGNIFVSTTRGGTITAGTTSGYMNISDVKAESASLSSVSGSISVRNAELTGVLTLHTTSGDIDLDDISAAGIETDTTSGDLELDEVDTQSLTFTSTSGDISGELLHADEFGGTVTTVSGDISGIRSGSEGTRTFKIETVSGDIDLDD